MQQIMDQQIALHNSY